MDLADFLGKLDNVKALPSGFSARCPAHHDTVSSLMVNEGRTQPVVVHCHAGCTVEQVVAALGLTMRDLQGEQKIIATYEYRTADDEVAYRVDRYTNPKTFRVQGSLPSPAERVPYQLPAFEWARSAGVTVHYVEGEKDADRLISMGHLATTTVSGAGSWLGHYGPMFAGLDVTVWADNDLPGRAHARVVKASIEPFASAVRLVVPRYGKDVSDLLDAGYGLDECDPLPETDDVAEYMAANVRTRRVEWAWEGYFPFGKLSIVEGDPGDGKSILTLDLASRWSTGAPMPDGTRHGGPWPVTLVSAEDDVEDTIVPRLVAAGARLDLIGLVPHGATPDRPFDFAVDLGALQRRVIDRGVRIVIFDPLTAFLPAGVDSHNDMQVRQALYPLKQFALRTRAVVLAVRHLNKSSGGVKAVYRGNGSIAFTGAARVGFLVTVDPDDPTARLLACVKSNLAAKPPTMRYAVETGPGGVPYLGWRGTSDTTAQAALDGPRRDGTVDDEQAGKKRLRDYAVAFLDDVLSDGPMRWPDIVDAGKLDGFSDHQLRSARADMGLVKIVGPAGARDVRWARRATAELAVNASDLHEQVPVCPSATLGGGQTGGSPQTANGQTGGSSSDEDRAAEVEAAPAECTVCHTDEAVIRFLGPWWTVRCLDHDPRYYGPEK